MLIQLLQTKFVYQTPLGTKIMTSPHNFLAVGRFLSSPPWSRRLTWPAIFGDGHVAAQVVLCNRTTGISAAQHSHTDGTDCVTVHCLEGVAAEQRQQGGGRRGTAQWNVIGQRAQMENGLVCSVVLLTVKLSVSLSKFFRLWSAKQNSSVWQSVLHNFQNLLRRTSSISILLLTIQSLL